MNPEPSLLLYDLTGPVEGDGEFLLRALRVRKHRRNARCAAALGVLMVAALAVLASTRLPARREGRPAPLVAALAATPSPLTESELLDSFQDQPVALVTWPDGRQQLLAIARPAPKFR